MRIPWLSVRCRCEGRQCQWSCRRSTPVATLLLPSARLLCAATVDAHTLILIGIMTARCYTSSRVLPTCLVTCQQTIPHGSYSVQFSRQQCVRLSFALHFRGAIRFNRFDFPAEKRTPRDHVRNMCEDGAGTREALITHPRSCTS